MGLPEIASTILMLALIGFVVYLIITYIPMPAIFSQVIMVVTAVALIIWVIGVFTGNAQPINIFNHLHH